MLVVVRKPMGFNMFELPGTKCLFVWDQERAGPAKVDLALTWRRRTRR
jgi:hypothetical protein